MQKTKKMRIAVVVMVFLIIGLVALVLGKMPKPVISTDNEFNLAQLQDGLYAGSCDNGLVKVRVEVVVVNHNIAQVQIIEHDNGLGGPAEAITDEIVQRQSVELDGIAGATMSTKTILKAVENALAKGQEI